MFFLGCTDFTPPAIQESVIVIIMFQYIIFWRRLHTHPYSDGTINFINTSTIIDLNFDILDILWIKYM